MAGTAIGLRPNVLGQPIGSLAAQVASLQCPRMRSDRITTLKRHATDVVKEVKRNREPILITRHGLPSAYLADAASFEAMQQRMSLLESLAREERAVEKGRVLSPADARQRMSRWLQQSGPINKS